MLSLVPRKFDGKVQDRFSRSAAETIRCSASGPVVVFEEDDERVYVPSEYAGIAQQLGQWARKSVRVVDAPVVRLYGCEVKKVSVVVELPSRKGESSNITVESFGYEVTDKNGYRFNVAYGRNLMGEDGTAIWGQNARGMSEVSNLVNPDE